MLTTGALVTSNEVFGNILQPLDTLQVASELTQSTSENKVKYARDVLQAVFFQTGVF